GGTPRAAPRLDGSSAASPRTSFLRGWRFEQKTKEIQMKVKLLASVAAVGVLAAGAVSAQPSSGWYGAIDAGAHWADDVEAQSELGPQWDIEASPNGGWTALGRIGYRINPNWRMELEGGYRSGDIGTIRN